MAAEILSQSMNNHYPDFEELRLTGEAPHVLDVKLNEGFDGDPRRQRVATITGGYPDEPAATNGECRSCGTSIPTGQTKYRFCLTHHLGDDATGTDGLMQTALLGIIHLIVESTTFYGAVAKGGAAANLLSANDAEPAVDDYTLIYDLDEAPARQLAEQWPSLPDAVQVSAKEGERLLSAARDRQGGTGRKRRIVRSRHRRGSTTSAGTASATRHGSLRSSTTPTMRCGWFQRWR